MVNPEKLIRENIKNLVPYASARDEFSGNASIFLDANENNLGSPLPVWYNRYPDPHQTALKEAISKIKGGIISAHIFIGNGSDECIDILYKCFCEPGIDNIIICPPTYGMYEVNALIHNIEVREAPLLENFQLNLSLIESLVNEHTKIIWLCSPNNPTGNSLYREDIEMVLNNFNGLVVIDEAYINFSPQKSFLQELPEYANLVVLQTLSKAWGLAGLRVGLAFAHETIIAAMNKVKAPYNVNVPAQQLAIEALQNVEQVNANIKKIVVMRNQLAKNLQNISVVEHVFPSDANFLLVQVKDAQKLYHYLLQKGIVVRDRSNVILCNNCLRISIGTELENEALLKTLQTYAANNMLQKEASIQNK